MSRTGGNDQNQFTYHSYSGNEQAGGPVFQQGPRKNSKGAPWAVIVLLLIVFWPLGMFLLYRKLTVDLEGAQKNGTVAFVTGWIFLALGAIYIAAITDYSQEPMYYELAITTVIFILSGLFMVLLGRKTKKNGIKYQYYLSLVRCSHPISLQEIAEALAISKEQVAMDLEKMVYRGYFGNGFVDRTRSVLVTGFHRTERQETQLGNATYDRSTGTVARPAQSNPVETDAETHGPVMKTVVCRNCGASCTIVQGAPGQCEYCGTALS